MITTAQVSPHIAMPTHDAWWSPFTSVADVEVAHVDLGPNPAREDRAYRWLDEEERAAWGRYAPSPRRRFSLCRAALRAILCDRLGCRNEELSFGESEHGKPFALVGGEASPIGFNVSHGGGHGLIAVAASGRVGVDVEERVPKRRLDDLIEAVMGPDERAELAALRDSEKLAMFYRLWTFKEALIKALGTGFSTDVSRFQAPTEMRRGCAEGSFVFPHLPSVSWGLADIGGDRFAAALAYELPRPRTGEP